VCLLFDIFLPSPFHEIILTSVRKEGSRSEEAVLLRAHQIENLITDNDEKAAVNDALKSLRVLIGLFEWL
jgi:hypothetical protein